MKETKLIKFNIFLLVLCIIFSVPLMTGLFSKTAKPASAEEPGIPLETYYSRLDGFTDGIYLDGEYVWEESKMDYYSKTETSPLYNLTSKGHISLKRKIEPAFLRSKESIKNSRIPIEKLSNINDLSYEVLFKIKNKILSSQGTMMGLPWSGVNLEYSISYYKNGKNIYTKNYKSNNIPTKGNTHKEYIYNLSTFKAEHVNKHGKGLYVFHIKSISTTLYYWDFEKTYEWLKDHVFAFQIGDDDSVKTTVTGSNINGETKDLTNSMYSSKEEAEKHPIYTRTVPTITAETTYNQMSLICGNLYNPENKTYRRRMIGHSHTFDEIYDCRQITIEIVTLKGLDKRYITIFYDPYKPMIGFKLEKPTNKYDERHWGRSISKLTITDDGFGNCGVESTSLQKWIWGIGYQEHGDIDAAINDKITEEGEWRIIARDKAGNENVKYFTISNQFKMEMDKDVQPDNKVLYTNKDVKLTFKTTPSTNQQQVKIETYDSHGNLINEIWRDIQSGSKSIYLSDIHYPEATDNFKDGEYYFCAWDWTGTMIKQRFGIDHGKPVLKADAKIIGTNIYTNKESLRFQAIDNERLHRIDVRK